MALLGNFGRFFLGGSILIDARTLGSALSAFCVAMNLTSFESNSHLPAPRRNPG